MPTKDKHPKDLMGMVHAYHSGKLKLRDLPDQLGGKVKKISSDLKDKEAKKMAKANKKKDKVVDDKPMKADKKTKKPIKESLTFAKYLLEYVDTPKMVKRGMDLVKLWRAKGAQTKGSEDPKFQGFGAAMNFAADQLERTLKQSNHSRFHTGNEEGSTDDAPNVMENVGQLITSLQARLKRMKRDTDQQEGAYLGLSAAIDQLSLQSKR